MSDITLTASRTDTDPSKFSDQLNQRGKRVVGMVARLQLSALITFYDRQ